MINPGHAYPEVAFMVDENYRGRGIASALLNYLIDIARERNIKGFRTEVLMENRSMMRVFEKLPYEMRKTVDEGSVSLTFDFDELKSPEKRT
jgi:GNAT superfamily N-acetyltransferase